MIRASSSTGARPAPFFREAGNGPGVVCLHANASSSSQWRGLMEALSPAYRVLAPDLYDAGRGPHWPPESTFALRDEVSLVEPLLERAGPPVALVGHSYGAAVALMTALIHPERVSALALYEPTLFALLDAERPAPNDADGIRNAAARAAAALDSGDPDAAARHFIDYWMGEGAWNAMPMERKPPIAASVAHVRRWAHALFMEKTPLEAFLRLDVPVLYMIGKRSTASALGVARLLTQALPHVQVVEFGALGHMGPVTHPGPVNAEISRFLPLRHVPARSLRIDPACEATGSS